MLNHLRYPTPASACLTVLTHRGGLSRRAIVIRSADILVSPTKRRHNGNSRQGLSEMSGKVTSFFPRGAVPDQDDAYRFMREIEISRCARTESRDYGMSRRLEDLVTD